MSVEVGDTLLILDAGTGIRALGTSPVVKDKNLFILLTHLHSDHIQGFPFFGPLYERDRVIHLLDYERDGRSWSLAELLDGVHFPLGVQDLPSRCLRITDDPLAFLEAQGLHVRQLEVNHPGGAYGYRIEHEGRTWVHIPDNELQPPGTSTTTFDAFVAFCAGADVLSHDAQYLENELNAKWGWGHSTVEHVCQLAVAAQVRHLVLFHHDPGRTDAMLVDLQGQVRRRLAKYGIACTAAYEGLALELCGTEAADDL